MEFLDEKTGAPIAEPFQLSIRPGVASANCSAASTGGEADSVVICDGGSAVYLLRLEKSPQPRLALVTKATLKVPALSRIASLGAAAYVVDAVGTVQVLGFPELKAKGGAKLDCRAAVSGPFAAGKHVLLETDKGELVCLDAAGKQAWKIAVVGCRRTCLPAAKGPLTAARQSDFTPPFFAFSSGNPSLHGADCIHRA